MPCSKYKGKQRALCYMTKEWKDWNQVKGDIKKELKIGTKIEMEHTKSKKVAKRIAIDHLKEFPRYYTKGLIPMEKRLKKLNLKKLKGGIRKYVKK